MNKTAVKGLSAAPGSNRFGSLKKETGNVKGGKIMGKMVKVGKAKKKK